MPIGALEAGLEVSRDAVGNVWGSRAVIGEIAPDVPETIVGFDGVTLAEAMRDVGLDPARCGARISQPSSSFNIEQGPVLEEADLPAALVTGIAAIRGTLVEIKGTANHSSPFRWHTAATRWPALPSRST